MYGVGYNTAVKDLYELISRKKLSTPDKVLGFCFENKFKEVLETCFEALVITHKAKGSEVVPSLFSFSASLTLSGSNYPCESLMCRMDRVAELAKFSCLYSDRTTIYNPFDFVYFYLNPQDEPGMSDERFRKEAANAFMISLEFRPLIERGLIVFSKTISLICSECKKKKDKKVNSIVQELEAISKNTLFPLLKEEIEIEYGDGFFNLAGIDSLIGDNVYLHYKKFPTFLLKSGKKVESLKRLEYNNPLVQRIVGEAIDSLVFQKIDNLESLTQTYLTSNVLERLLLEKLQIQTESRAFTMFTEGLPIVQDLSYEEIMKTRDSYPDEFGSFQEHVSNLVTKARAFETQKEFDTYISSKLKRDLKDLEKIQNEAKRKLRIKGFAEGAFLSAAIAISPLPNSAIPGILGVAKAIYGCTKLVTEADETEKRVRRSPLFFYYKLSRARH